MHVICATGDCLDMLQNEQKAFEEENKFSTVTI